MRQRALMYPATGQNHGVFCTDAEHEAGDIEQCVLQILACHGVGRTRLERRSEERFPFPYVMYITPASDPFDGSSAEPAIPIVGKHLSKHGLDFYHRDPLPHRHIIVKAEVARGHLIQLLLDITWCRFIRQGWYSSGGKFLGVVDTPAAEEPKTQARITNQHTRHAARRTGPVS